MAIAELFPTPAERFPTTAEFIRIIPIMAELIPGHSLFENYGANHNHTNTDLNLPPGVTIYMYL